MTATLSALLKSWGLSSLKEEFQEKNITIETLECLNPNDPIIDTIIPDIGRLIIFKKKFTEYKKDLEELFAEPPKHHNDLITDVASDESEEDTDSEAELDFGNVIPRKNGKKEFHDQIMNINWRELLENNSNGSMCLDHYKLFGELTPNLYTRLLMIVTGELIKCVWQGNKKFYRVNYDLLDSTADKLVGIFGNIPKSTFFIHPRITLETHPRDKLWDAYRKDTTQLRLLGIKTKNTKRDNDAEPPKKRRKVDDSTEAEIFEAAKSFEWLKEHPDSTDWHAIKYHWSNSYNNRMENWENLENSNCVFTEFPMLQKPDHGFRLLVMDYEILAETDVDAKQKWPQFSKKLLTLMKDKLKAPVFIQMLRSVTDDSLIDKAAMLLRLLPAVIPVTWLIAHNLSTATNKEDWKPSIDEGMDGFILHVKIKENLEDQLSARTDNYNSRGFNVQPFLVVVGLSLDTITHTYVVINGYKFLAKDVLDGLNICFKIIQVLNIDYAPECQPTWLFLQRVLFERTSDYDEERSKVNTLITKYNKIKN